MARAGLGRRAPIEVTDSQLGLHITLGGDVCTVNQILGPWHADESFQTFAFSEDVVYIFAEILKFM